MDDQTLLQLPVYFSQNLDTGWTFFLLLARLAALFVLIPGLSGGPSGMAIRTPGLMAIAVAGLGNVDPIPLPEHLGEMLLQIFSEVFLGGVLGIIPTLIISGVQTGGQLASTSMGLGAGQLLDPTTQTSTTQLARIFSDLLVISFLLLNGHHVLLYAGLGLGGQVIPASFTLGTTTLDVLVEKSSEIFVLAAVVSAPVVVAILMTQFILGICTKLVSQLNIFIVSFPLTIGLGLIMSAIVIPMYLAVGNSYLATIDSSIVDILSDAKMKEKP